MPIQHRRCRRWVQTSLILAALVAFSPSLRAAVCDRLLGLREDLASATERVNFLTPQVAEAEQKLLTARQAATDFAASAEYVAKRTAADRAESEVTAARGAYIAALEREVEIKARMAAATDRITTLQRELQRKQSSLQLAELNRQAALARARAAEAAAAAAAAETAAEAATPGAATEPTEAARAEAEARRKLNRIRVSRFVAQRELTRGIGRSFIEGLSETDVGGLDRLDLLLAEVDAQVSTDVAALVRTLGDAGSDLHEKLLQLVVALEQFATGSGVTQRRAEIDRLRSEIRRVRDAAHKESARLRKIITTELPVAEQELEEAVEALVEERAADDGTHIGIELLDQLGNVPEGPSPVIPEHLNVTPSSDPAATKREIQQITSQIADQRAALATSESQLVAHGAELERLRLALEQAESRAKAADQAFQTARDRERQLRVEVVAAEEARRLARESLAEAEDTVFRITTQISIAEDEIEQIRAQINSLISQGQAAKSRATRASLAGNQQACLSDLGEARSKLEIAASLAQANNACFAHDRVSQLNGLLGLTGSISCGGRSLDSLTADGLVEVPNVIGKQFTEAEQLLVGAGFTPLLVTTTSVPGSIADAGVVTGQNPAHPERKAAGTQVVVSHYDSLRVVPAVTKMGFVAAANALAAVDLVGYPVAHQTTDESKTDREVYGQSEPPGKKVFPGTSVTLDYWERPASSAADAGAAAGGSTVGGEAEGAGGSGGGGGVGGGVAAAASGAGEGSGSGSNPFDEAAERGSGAGSGEVPEDGAARLDPGPHLDEASSALTRCDYAAANAALGQAAAIDPGHPRLTSLYAERDRRLAAEQQVLGLLTQAAAYADVTQQVAILQQAQQAAPCPMPQLNSVTSQLLSASAGAKWDAVSERSRARRAAASSILGPLIAIRKGIIDRENARGRGGRGSGSGGSATSGSGGSSTSGTASGGGARCGIVDLFSTAYADPEATLAHLVYRLDPTGAPYDVGYGVATVPSRGEGVCDNPRACLAHLWRGVPHRVLSEHSSAPAARAEVRRLCPDPVAGR